MSWLVHGPRWVRTPLCCIAMVLLAWNVVSPQVQASPSVRTATEIGLRNLVRQPVSLGRNEISVADDLSPIPFPNQFRHDPLAGMDALEQWQTALRGSRQNAAAVLHETLALAYVRPRWHVDHSPDLESEQRTVTVTPAIAWPADLPAELRSQVAPLLHAIAQAQTSRQQALAQWPSEVSADDVWKRLGSSDHAPEGGNGISTQALLNRVDHQALARGIWQLTAAVEQAARLLENHVRKQKPTPGSWRVTTPWGEVIIDTTATNNHYQGQQPLLLIDTAGNDNYSFDQERPPGVTVLLDLAGNDRYQGGGLGRDASAATLGYAVLLDASGDDIYEGQWLTQGAALFGAAALIDQLGQDRYQARGQAQGFALGGIAALLDFDGDDNYHALSQSQASAGPGGLALLFDHAGNDRYVLANTPLVLPSAQLTNSNASLGQGTAFGMRNKKTDDTTASIPGGLALLLDAGGDDVYEAQVFAQGAGYEGGLGVLWDGAGSDQMSAAWYALGAAAHGGGGVFVAGGSGNDIYRVSHATSLGAAHDGSVGIFVGGLGHDRYSLSTLGFGAAHDGSAALFLERGGREHYQHTHPHCRGFGASVYSDAHLIPNEATPTHLTNTALFMDLSGADHYPPNCPEPSNGWRWSVGDAEIGMGTGTDVTVRRPQPGSTSSRVSLKPRQR